MIARSPVCSQPSASMASTMDARIEVHGNDTKKIALHRGWFAFGHILIGAGPLAAQDDCKLVLDAMTKVFDTPTHAYVTMNMSGKPQTGESIYAGG